jgi:predicted acetyltransferase
MKIVAYRDLESKNGLLPLQEQAFGWPFNEREFNRFTKTDPRLKNGAVGFCAVEHEKVVSYVGVLDLATRTLDRTLKSEGGIYGVATLPEHTRQGLSTALFNTAHEHFKEKGYQFSFLNTSPNLVAYSLYKKLGYSDATSYPSAYKIIKPKKTTTPKEKTPAKPDLNKLLATYNTYVKNKTGLVVRDKQYLERLMKDKRLTGRGISVSEKGYVIYKKEPDATRIRELIAQNKEEMNKLIGAVEEKTREVLFAKAVLDQTLLQTYQARGYTVLQSGHSVFMAKLLTTQTSLKHEYGENFFQTDLDHF